MLNKNRLEGKNSGVCIGHVITQPFKRAVYGDSCYRWFSKCLNEVWFLAWASGLASSSVAGVDDGCRSDNKKKPSVYVPEKKPTCICTKEAHRICTSGVGWGGWCGPWLMWAGMDLDGGGVLFSNAAGVFNAAVNTGFSLLHYTKMPRWHSGGYFVWLPT